MFRPILLSALLVALAAGVLLPKSADAGSRRRNYAEEMRQERLEDERRAEREKARQDYMKHQEEMQKRYLQHDERQLDTVIDHLDRRDGTSPPAAAPAPPKRTGSCIYGAGNKVVYQPDGVDCSR
jgi:hypothetical protein